MIILLIGNEAIQAQRPDRRAQAFDRFDVFATAAIIPGWELG
jgi:hypothetical protein